MRQKTKDRSSMQDDHRMESSHLLSLSPRLSVCLTVDDDGHLLAREQHVHPDLVVHPAAPLERVKGEEASLVGGPPPQLGLPPGDGKASPALAPEADEEERHVPGDGDGGRGGESEVGRDAGERGGGG